MRACLFNGGFGVGITGRGSQRAANGLKVEGVAGGGEALSERRKEKWVRSVAFLALLFAR